MWKYLHVFVKSNTLKPELHLRKTMVVMSINQLQHSGALYYAAQRIHIKAERKRGRMLIDVQIVFYHTFPYEALATDTAVAEKM